MTQGLTYYCFLASPSARSSENPNIAHGRQSKRHKRSQHSQASFESTPSNSSHESIDFSESTWDIGDWARRRIQARRSPLKSLRVQGSSVFELDGSIVHVNSPVDEDDGGLTEALQRGKQQNFEVAEAAGVENGTGENEKVSWSDMLVLRQPLRE